LNTKKLARCKPEKPVVKICDAKERLELEEGNLIIFGGETNSSANVAVLNPESFL
tara:strand:- start:53329 stop:53493 length:165 start_codon:yes stop_codon:yes gene_type:complete